MTISNHAAAVQAEFARHLYELGIDQPPERPFGTAVLAGALKKVDER